MDSGTVIAADDDPGIHEGHHRNTVVRNAGVLRIIAIGTEMVYAGSGRPA